jgi:diguanylate cyclase (GGDEF)-like protein
MSTQELQQPADPLERDVRRLGEALGDRCDEVLARTIARSPEEADVLDPVLRQSFERISAASTRAVARWLAGGSPEEGRETSRNAFETYGQLAAQRVASLHEVAKRTLRWRDTIGELLHEAGRELGIGREAVARANAMVQVTVDVTLVRMCQCFELERRRTDEELAFMATHDTLTGLPNRTLIVDRIEQALVRARRHKAPVAVLLIDVDNFKSVNDTLGHEAGDQLLRHLTERLDGVVRATDALGRLGGDEFVVIAEDLSPEAGPELVAQRMLDALSEPVRLSGAGETELTATASIGVAVGDRASAEELLRDADIAMYRAKQEGRNRFVVFESDMHHAIQDRMALEIDLQHALPNDEFFLVYQPTFALRDMRPTGVEALLRWAHPLRGVVQPNDFIPLLEETGLVTKVGRWVLQSACRQAESWRRAGHEISVAVNVSARQLDADEFVADVRDALAASGLDAHALTLEITETTLMRNTEATAARLGTVKDLGVRIAIDDFGTGYSSLAHLQRFPFDSLKIDRSFISRLTNSHEGGTLIRTLVQLGKALSIETLAEGIEQEAELSILRDEECDSGQGFLFARPLDVAAVESFLAGWRPTRPATAPLDGAVRHPRG